MTRSRPAVGQPAPEAPLRVVDLFCGAGGLSEGFRQAGYDVAAGDHDPDAVATYAANFPAVLALCGDVRAPVLREQIDEAGAGADVLVGGLPCQAFSQVRNHSRLIQDPRNSLYREFVSAVGAARPAAFLMENVPGMAQMGVKTQVLEDLGLDGEYRVEAQLVDAADFGVPQTRKRLLFFGVRADLGVPPPQLVGTGATAAVQLVRFASDTGASGAPTGPGYAVAARPDELGERIGIRLCDPLDDGVVSVAQALSDLSMLQAGRRGEALEPGETARGLLDLPAAHARGHDRRPLRRPRPVRPRAGAGLPGRKRRACRRRPARGAAAGRQPRGVPLRRLPDQRHRAACRTRLEAARTGRTPWTP